MEYSIYSHINRTRLLSSLIGSKIIEVNDTSVTWTPYIDAEFKGGIDGLILYIQQSIESKLINKKRLRKRLIDVKILIKFTITENGSVTNIELLKGCTNALQNQLAIDTVKEMPKWKAAKDVNNNPIKVYKILPLKFNIKSKKKSKKN